jgi:hypothetical protein
MSSRNRASGRFNGGEPGCSGRGSGRDHNRSCFRCAWLRWRGQITVDGEIHGRKSSGWIAAEITRRGPERGFCRAFVGGFPRAGLGKNDAAAGAISEHAERNVQLRSMYAVRSSERLQGSRRRGQQGRLVQGFRDGGLSNFAIVAATPPISPQGISAALVAGPTRL